MPVTSPKPKAGQSFFTNTYAHYKAILDKSKNALSSDQLNKSIEALTTSPSTPIRDRYDYLDEVYAPIAMPLLMIGISAFFLGYTAICLVKASAAEFNCLDIKSKIAYQEKLDEDYMDTARWAFNCLFTAAYVFFKALISLITRLIVTAVNKGYKDEKDYEDEMRFNYANGV